MWMLFITGRFVSKSVISVIVKEYMDTKSYKMI